MQEMVDNFLQEVPKAQAACIWNGMVSDCGEQRSDHAEQQNQYQAERGGNSYRQLQMQIMIKVPALEWLYSVKHKAVDQVFNKRP